MQLFVHEIFEALEKFETQEFLTSLLMILIWQHLQRKYKLSFAETEIGFTQQNYYPNSTLQQC